MEENNSTKSAALEFIKEVFKNYNQPLYSYLEKNLHLVQTVSGFLVAPEKIILYVSRTHIAIEYLGSENISKLPDNFAEKIECHDYSNEECNLVEKIIGFSYDATSSLSIPLAGISEDLLLPTNRGWAKLDDLGWNFTAQNSMMGMNIACPKPIENTFARIVNGMFFDADETGLKSRHIKWLEVIPIELDDSADDVDVFSFDFSFLKELVESDANYVYPLPDDYRYVQLPKINRFIEVWGSKNSSEPDITSFLAKPENEFIITMRFGAQAAKGELLCEWQSEVRKDIKPDFFIIQSNGYADILEFKLPDIEKSVVVGSENRETFGAWLMSYISQTRVYSTYFDDPSNRKWFEEKYGFKVYKPRRWLVVGRRADFDSDVWREIVADFPAVNILNFDDLIDGVVVQFYK
ncbi:DUF4263 domain-containing protein [Paraburkholderia fungorum]|uniref:DUF4263 domain-containing protein n=1 Tax=Paraburkholderia fungorum TaxID=134537 RepID=UPI001C1F050D|nr:DUF4263 domain-containing protein [Paraburkholderia fungorum]MBU7435848.1 DUF4263 domain-containing protein [Paraburkholderia fungorum]